MEMNLSLNSGLPTYTANPIPQTTSYYTPYYPQYQEIVHHYYPSYIGTWNEKSKIEQAFKIVQKLVDKKLITLKTVKDFIETVNEISEVL